jgi:hypothetical protein
MGKFNTAAMAEDARINQAFGDNGGMVPLRIDRQAYIKAVINNGTEITRAEGQEYWVDQVKKFPHLATNDKFRHIRVARGKSRFGQASMIFRQGHWFRVTAQGLMEAPGGAVKTRAAGYVLPSRCQE